MKLFKPTIVTDGGPWVQHNMPCLCLKNHAVYNMDKGRFEFCWECKREFKVKKRLFKKKVKS